MYRLLIKPITRRIKDNDKASAIAKSYFRFQGLIPGGRFVSRLIHGNRPTGLEREVFGLNFYNPVGLGAGLDVEGTLYNDLNDLGFSFVEIGPFPKYPPFARQSAVFRKTLRTISWPLVSAPTTWTCSASLTTSAISS